MGSTEKSEMGVRVGMGEPRRSEPGGAGLLGVDLLVDPGEAKGDEATANARRLADP